MQNNVITFNLWWCRNNYGAILTAYALQEIVKICGKKPYSFDDKCITNKNLFGEVFCKNYMSICNNDNSYKTIDGLNNLADTFITGSDQVFRAGLLGKNYSKYFLDFALPAKKKIAFSTSFGVDKEEFLKETPEEILNKVKISLKSFDFISVRENSGVKICRDLFDIEAEWIIDPVFILDKSKYDELINNATINYSDKIVAYVLDSKNEYKKAYKYLSKKYNEKVIETANSNISIENWLASIRDCELFVTDSFHGICFALIFNKPFICITNKSRGAARFDSICEMLGIENQCIDSILDIMQKSCVFNVDYKKINQKIAEERLSGLEFLKKSLNVHSNKTQEKTDVRTKYLENRICTLEKENHLTSLLKKIIWEKWRIIYNCYLPNFLKKTIGFFWYNFKRVIKK